jgi:hypothetical protein
MGDVLQSRSLRAFFRRHTGAANREAQRSNRTDHGIYAQGKWGECVHYKKGSAGQRTVDDPGSYS